MEISRVRFGPQGSGPRTELEKQLFRRALIVAEVSLAIVLVIGAGLMIRSFVRLQKVELGFDPRNLVTANSASGKVVSDGCRSPRVLDAVPRRRGQSARRQVGDAHAGALARHRAVYNGFFHRRSARRRRTTP